MKSATELKAIARRDLMQEVLECVVKLNGLLACNDYALTGTGISAARELETITSELLESFGLA